MHYERRYNLDDTAAADREACKDTLWYLSKPETYKMLAHAVRGGTSLDQLALYCGLAGIQGYPVQALHRRYSRT